MNSITEIISHIKLFRGHREDIKTTGHGCFMDVISYLNGDVQITDKSECVCPVIRPIAIYINDLLNDKQRYRLLPLVERAIGTANAPIEVIIDRAKAAAKFAVVCKNIFNSSIPNGNSYVYNVAVALADDAVSASNNVVNSLDIDLKMFYATGTARYAIKAAELAANKSPYFAKPSADYLNRKLKIIDAGIECLEEMCPPAEITDTTVIQRAKDFAEIYKRGRSLYAHL